VGVSLFSSRPTLGLSTATKLLHPRQVLLGLTTLFWCGRLGSFLFARISKDGSDSRFDMIKKSPLRFGVAWVLQGVWVTLTAYPAFFTIITPATSLASLGILDAIGVGLWVSGFSIEAIADAQKSTWAKQVGSEGRKTQFIDIGLWSYSRHPNYFGEITLWCGTALIAASAFRASPLRALSFGVSPLLTTFLLTRVSGIPLLEKSSDKRYDNLASYQSYKKRVPVLIPNPFVSKSIKND
jgi:steroid 5-alpha reductase family enzyme